MNLYEAIFVRKSVRNYCFDTLPPQTLDKIWEHYKEMPALFSGIGVDMAILDNRKGQERMLSMFSVKNLQLTEEASASSEGLRRCYVHQPGMAG